MEQRAARLRQYADIVIPSLLRDYNVETYDLHALALNEATYNCSKDLEKLEIYQKERVDPIKTFGYLAFWIRKIKPIHNATSFSKSPINDINERLSIWLLGATITRHLSMHAKTSEEKSKASAAADRFKIMISDKKRYDYLVYCLRTRTFGPHHYVLILQEMLSGV